MSNKRDVLALLKKSKHDVIEKSILKFRNEQHELKNKLDKLANAIITGAIEKITKNEIKVNKHTLIPQADALKTYLLYWNIKGAEFEKLENRIKELDDLLKQTRAQKEKEFYLLEMEIVLSGTDDALMKKVTKLLS